MSVLPCSKYEGRNRPSSTILGVWRGGGHPKEILLLDNDFFGSSDWRERADEIVSGGYKISLNQGINVRLIDDESAKALSGMLYYDDNFKQRRVYTAWDNLGDEKIFRRGIDRLISAGIPARRIMPICLWDIERARP